MSLPRHTLECMKTEIFCDHKLRVLTLYNLTSVCIFSKLFSKHFSKCWQEEFVQQSRASLVGDNSHYSCDLAVWFRGDIVTKHLNASHSLASKGYNGQNKMCLSKNWERRKKKVFWEMHRKKIVNMFFDFYFSISIYLMYPLFFSSIYFENSTVYRCKQLLKEK